MSWLSPIPWLPAAVVIAVVPVAGAAIGVVSGRARWRRGLSVSLAVGLLAAPFLGSGVGLLRAIAALSTSLTLFRVIDLARDPAARSIGQRAWHVVGIVDTRRITRVPSTLRWASVLQLLVFGALSAAAIWMALRVAPTIAEPAGVFVRWLAGALFYYCAFEVLAAFVDLVYRLLGLRVPQIHDAPIRSRTIAEFWGRRWNRVVSSWLRLTCFLPLARRGSPGLGMLAAFAASVVLHVYVAWVALDLRAALIVGAFFAVQVPLLLLERAFGVARWPAYAARGWTLGLLLLVSPLFVMPVLGVFAQLW